MSEEEDDHFLISACVPKSLSMALLVMLKYILRIATIILFLERKIKVENRLFSLCIMKNLKTVNLENPSMYRASNNACPYEYEI